MSPEPDDGGIAGVLTAVAGVRYPPPASGAGPVVRDPPLEQA